MLLRRLLVPDAIRRIIVFCKGARPSTPMGVAATRGRLSGSRLPTAAGARGAVQTWITAHARSRGLVLVTHNTREFNRVPALVVEDWLVA